MVVAVRCAPRSARWGAPPVPARASAEAEAGGRACRARWAQEAAGRVAELLPIRYGRMASSPFAFLRGLPIEMMAHTGV